MPIILFLFLWIFIASASSTEYLYPDANSAVSACLVDFKGRANVASTKNCQFIESSPQDSSESSTEEYEKDFLFQMGKITEDCFNVDIKYPMSLLQAFSVCVSRFDAKLNW